MDPFVLAAGAVSVAGLGTAWQMHRRASQAEAVAADLTNQLRAERHAASHDALTGLPNRRAFYQLGADLAADTARPPLAAIVLDLDDFKQINDRLGHAAGDEVLITVARRLAAYPGDNLMARLGGDEFAGLLTTATLDQEWLDTTTRALTEHLAAPMPIAGHWVRITVSVGLAPVPPGSHLAEALSHADAAMYRAKASGLAPVRSGELRRQPEIRPSTDAPDRNSDTGVRDSWPDRNSSTSARQLVDTTPCTEAGGQ